MIRHVDDAAPGAGTHEKEEPAAGRVHCEPDRLEETPVEMPAIPRHRVMACKECEADVDREVEKCHACGQCGKDTRFRLSELGAAERFAFLHAGRLRHCGGLGGWFAYDGKRWAKDAQTTAVQCAKRMITDLYSEMPHLDESDGKALIAHIAKSETSRAIEGILRLAQSEEEIATKAEAFDRDPWVLNVQNGTIDLKTFALRPHNPRDLLSKVAGARYEPDATSELWERALREWMGGDETLVDFVQVAAGYTATGSTREEKLFFVHGPANGGKSTFIEAVRRVLGDYAVAADFESFVRKSNSSGARNDIVRLAGARLCSSIEVEEGKHLAQGLVKQITGGDVVAARYLYKEFVEFVPAFKLWLIANDAPHVDSEDGGMWRRIAKISFEHVVPPEKRKTSVKETLCNPEVSGAAILAWMMAGCAKWQKHGLVIPEVVATATQAYRESQDMLREFFEDHVVLDPNATTSRNAIRTRYESWAKTSGTKNLLSPRNFNERVAKLEGVSEDKAHGVRGWRGIRLTVADNAFEVLNETVRGSRGQDQPAPGAGSGAADSSGKQPRGQLGQVFDITSPPHTRDQKVIRGSCPRGPESQIPDESPAPEPAPVLPPLPPRRKRSELRPRPLAGAPLAVVTPSDTPADGAIRVARALPGKGGPR